MLINKTRVERLADLILEFDSVNKTWYIEKYKYGEDKIFTTSKGAMLLIHGSENPIIKTKVGEKKGVDEMGKQIYDEEVFPWDDDLRKSKKSSKVTTKSSKGVPEVKNVIYSPPATIIQWADGTKTIVKATEGEDYDPVFGYLMAYFQKATGMTKTQVGKLCDGLIEDFAKQQSKKYKEELEEIEGVKADLFPIELPIKNVVEETVVVEQSPTKIQAVEVDVNEIFEGIVNGLNALKHLVDKN